MLEIPRGTRDFTSAEMLIRRKIEENIRSTFLSYGYGEIQTPTFEHLELFTVKSGESIIQELYDFKDKGGRHLTLRPELTAPVMRCYVEKLQMEPKPLKLFYFGNCFRYDRPQKGRYREFWQAGCELIGANTPEAHAELITLAYTILKNMGLQNIHLNIGNLTILQAVFQKFGISPLDQKKLLPFLDKAQFEEVRRTLYDSNLPDTHVEQCISLLQTTDVNEIKKCLEDAPDIQEEITNMETILQLLQSVFHVPSVSIKLSIVRGLDYYKSLVFEIEAPVLGAEKQLCGGGVYDLIGLFGGTPVPTAGFAIGFDRSILALETEQYVFPQPRLDIFIIPVTEELIGKAFEIAGMLRNKGVTVDVDLLRRGIGKSLKYASSRNAQKVIIIGPNEIQNNVVTLRDMHSGNQKTIPIEEIMHYYTKS